MKGRVLLFIFVQFIAVAFSMCPTGRLSRSDGKCCRPIRHCAPGHEVKPCATSEYDECVPCPKGQRNPFSTSSFEMIPCRPNRCSSGAILGKNNNCVCNVLDGYYGTDASLCLNGGPRCPKGKELKVNGRCSPCDSKYYKDWDGYGVCKKQFDCHSLQLEYKERGNSQTPATCKEQQTVSEVFEVSEVSEVSEVIKQTTGIPTSTSISEGQILIQHITKIVEKLQPTPDHIFKSETSKSSNIAKKSVFSCKLQIVVVVLGTLLFISFLMIVHMFVTKHCRSRRTKTSPSSKGSIPAADWFYTKNQRPLPSLPEADQYMPMNVSRHDSFSSSRHDSCSSSTTQECSRSFKQAQTTLPSKGSIPAADWYYAKNQRPLPSLPEADRYMPMDVSRHNSCSSSTTQESFKAFKQDAKNDWIYPEQDQDDSSFPTNEQPYVKIEPLVFD